MAPSLPTRKESKLEQKSVKKEKERYQGQGQRDIDSIMNA